MDKWIIQDNTSGLLHEFNDKGKAFRAFCFFRVFEHDVRAFVNVSLGYVEAWVNVNENHPQFASIKRKIGKVNTSNKTIEPERKR